MKVTVHHGIGGRTADENPLDTRGEFNVITKAAINLIEKNNRVLKKLRTPEIYQLTCKGKKQRKLEQ